MTAARKLELVSPEEYLARELDGEERHEYVAGVIHAMAGARNRHNAIAMNVQGTLFTLLRGKPCRPCNSDTKIRIRRPSGWRFYYPDATVVCKPNPPEDTFQDEPVLVVEVLSESTWRTDVGEKKDAYLTIPSLNVLMLVEQDWPGVVVYRRVDNDFAREVYEGMEAIVALPEIDGELSLRELYEGIGFPPDTTDEIGQ